MATRARCMMLNLRLHNNASTNAASREVRSHRRRRGLTLAELIVASVIAATLAGVTTVAVRQAADARNRSSVRQEAQQRAYAVTQLVARDLANMVRDEELAQTMVRVADGDLSGTDFDRDELLIFVRSQRPARGGSITNGSADPEGGTYEVQFRLIPDTGDVGTVWMRRDPVPDDTVAGGGVATPVVSGIVSLKFEVFDGDNWVEDWESDEDGMPFAVRVTCESIIGETSATAYAQCVVAIDRVPKPVWMVEDDPNFDLFGNGDQGEDLFGSDPFGDDGSGGGGFGGGGN